MCSGSGWKAITRIVWWDFKSFQRTVPGAWPSYKILCCHPVVESQSAETKSKLDWQNNVQYKVQFLTACLWIRMNEYKCPRILTLLFWEDFLRVENYKVIRRGDIRRRKLTQIDLLSFSVRYSYPTGYHPIWHTYQACFVQAPAFKLYENVTRMKRKCFTIISMAKPVASHRCIGIH